MKSSEFWPTDHVPGGKYVHFPQAGFAIDDVCEEFGINAKHIYWWVSDSSGFPFEGEVLEILYYDGEDAYRVDPLLFHKRKVWDNHNDPIEAMRYIVRPGLKALQKALAKEGVKD